ncbi:uncharacterized protein LOC121068320 isoform X2 [Cygnus olor]|uniref:uncharacterized protein LOC121068320 isoform X2 n=1 Tax=Cygnus olor TaxID=8869 RepID=UPI001ADE5B9E|nr:uncharacterized protein LOC121068320 isoform X2 [Cygnus olor]
MGMGTGAGFGGMDECNGLWGHREICGLKSEKQCPCRRIYCRGTEIAVSPLFLGQMELLCPASREGALGKGPRGPLGDPTEMTQPASSLGAEGESQGAQECLAQHSHHLPSPSPSPPPSPPPPPPHRLNLELPEDSSESTTSDTESETSCSSTVSLDSWSTISCTTITESESTQISRASTPTPLQKEDSLHASVFQPGLMHPKAGPGEQHDHDTCQPCRKEVVRCHRASSVHQHQQHVQVQQAAPTHPPEVPKFHSMEMKTSLPQKKSKEALNYFTSHKKEEEKLRLPADGDKPPQNDPASALKVSKQEEEPNMKAVPMVWDLTFIDKAVKNQLEHVVEKMYIQKQFGLSEMLLSCEGSFSATVLEARTAVPTTAPRSPQWRAEPHVVVTPVEKDPPCVEKTVNHHLEGPNGQKQTKELFGLPGILACMKRSSDPVLGQKDSQTEPVHSVPAAILRVEQGMKPQEDGDRPHQKMECGGRASGSSTTSKTTLPGTSKMNQDPGAVGDSPSIQAEQAWPQSKGAPRGQSDKKGEGPSISTTGDMGTPTSPRRRPPQRKHSSSEDRPSALPRPPHHIWIALDMPHIPEVLVAPRDCHKAKKIAKDLQKQVQASQPKQLPDNAGQSWMDPAAEGTGAVPRRRRRRARKDKGCSQDGPIFARLRPKCIKAPNHNLSATESSQNLAPSATAVPGAAGGETVGEKKPSADRAKGQQDPAGHGASKQQIPASPTRERGLSQ